MGNVTSSQPKNKTGKKVVAQCWSRVLIDGHLRYDMIQTLALFTVLSLTEHGLEEIPDQVYISQNA
eukprot:scaffold22937_cov73-Cyclotella_meneghiniana.AAC.4